MSRIVALLTAAAASGTRVSGDALVRDEAGVSTISGADLAIAFVDELEKPRHENVRFTVAY